MTHSKRLISNLLLVVAAFIWGSAFVAQSVGMDYIGPLTFNATRSFIGALVLLPVIRFMDHRGNPNKPVTAADRKILLTGGLCCGLVLFCGSTLQQIGLTQTSAGKAGFITAMYIIIVPLLGLFFKKHIPAFVWISVVLGVTGMYLLCVTEGFSLQWSDTMVILSAFFFAGHILVIDHFSPRVDGVRLSALQFSVAGILSLIAMFIFEQPDFSAILSAWMPLLYAGVLSSGIAYTLQIVAQKHTDPTVASLLMSLESVFAALSGAVILRETLSGRELTGCVLMFIAIILAQLPEKKK